MDEHNNTELENPHWDLVGALARVNNDEKFLREVVEIFLQRLMALLANIESAIREKNSEMLVMNSHTVKGSAGNMLAAPTMEIASRLESLAEKNEFAAMDGVWRELQQETSQLHHMMTRWLNDGEGESANHQG